MSHVRWSQLPYGEQPHWRCLVSLPGSQSSSAGPGCKERHQNTPGCPPALPKHPHRHVGLILHQLGQNTEQPATTEISFEAVASWLLDRHLHQQTLPSLLMASPSPWPPPTLAVLNTTALCHLVILGKKDCSWRQQPHRARRAGFAPGLRGSPGFVPCWYNRDDACWHRESALLAGLPAEGMHHPLVFCGSTAQSGFSLQAANEHWAWSHWEQAGPSVSVGGQGLHKASKAVTAPSAFAGGRGG